eukprot:TRINITY_DN1314_c0_g1_i6.p1 TRINITY_DN1314_c0_g1~~TRINITY_DN1314_c0_g1_i6.p1  ORF type:complete len:581 (-),score=143.93 TRINITY_DN1314_c0_g1_i6:112-1854(-)
MKGAEEALSAFGRKAKYVQQLEAAKDEHEAARAASEAALAKRTRLLLRVVAASAARPEIVWAHGKLPIKAEERTIGQLALRLSGCNADDFEFVEDGKPGAGCASVQVRKIGGVKYFFKEFRLRDEAERKMFVKEARLLGRLAHAQVAAVHGVMVQPAVAHIVMRYYAGGDLVKWLERERTTEQRIVVARDVFAGLAHIHARRVVHCDVKPANILVDEDGRAAVADFGVSRDLMATVRGRSLIPQALLAGAPAGRGLVGSLDFMAPEVKEEQEPSAQSDVYSAGLVVKLLFGSARLSAQQKRDLEDLVARLLQRAPAERLGAQAALQHAFLRAPGADRSNVSAIAAPGFWSVREPGAARVLREPAAVCRMLEKAMQATDPAKRRFRVHSVERIENIAKLRVLLALRESVRALHNGGCAAKVEVVTGSALDSDFLGDQDLDSRVNEVMLWHATSGAASTVNAIKVQGLDPRFKTVNGALFGQGTYFAESMGKAHHYATTRTASGHHVVLLCRVVLGEPLVTSEMLGDEMRRPPVNAATGAPHESVVAAAGASSMTAEHGAHREFVVFDQHLCYPQYLIEYTV